MRPRFAVPTVASLVAGVLLVLVAVPARAQLVSRFEVRETVISPDGDGKQDSTRIRYALADTVLSVGLYVFAADSVTPVDTLRAPQPAGANGDVFYYWKGQRWDGTPAPEGAYVVTLAAVGLSQSATMSLPVFIDVTPPSIQILSVIPAVYAPGVAQADTAASISFTISNASPVYPGRVPDELTTEILEPGGTAVTPLDIVTRPAYAGANGSYVTSWDGRDQESSLADGEYTVTLALNDAAGYTARSTYHFEVDTRAPSIRTTNVSESASLRVVPDSLRGSAFDARGVDSLYVRYPSSPYMPVASTTLRNDSLMFAVVLADSFLTEGRYQLLFRAVDTVGRVGTLTFTFTYDETAPAAPALDPYNGVWRAPRYPLSGTVEAGLGIGIVSILRNGTRIDSLTLTTSNHFSTDVILEAGRNDLVAYVRDPAGNQSPLSNTVSVTFDSGSGFFAPAPFVPGAFFDVNAPRVASSTTLRIYDINGDLVTFFNDDTPQQFYSFQWSGRNSSDQPVRKGPLVGVAVVDYADGTRDVFRGTFLYNPDAQ